MINPLSIENLGPRNENVLRECAASISKIHEVIEGKTRKFQEDVIYDFVAMGLYFLKAKKAIGHGDFMEFVKLETVSNLGITDRSARNYMNCCRNAGLTEQHEYADVEMLRAAGTLNGRKPTELYRLADSMAEDAIRDKDTPRQVKADLIRDAAVILRESCEHLVSLRDQMNKHVFSTVCARLHRTLEELTACGWEMNSKTAGETQFFR